MKCRKHPDDGRTTRSRSLEWGLIRSCAFTPFSMPGSLHSPPLFSAPVTSKESALGWCPPPALTLQAAQ
jgi:hypothetical protein